MKLNKIQIAFIILLIILIIFKISEPKPIDWSEGFSLTETKPYGSSTLFENLNQSFTKGEISISNYPIYNFLKDNNSKNRSYIFITDEFKPDKLDLENLFSFVENGNNVFISTYWLPSLFKDSFNIKINYDYNSREIYFVNKNISIDTFIYEYNYSSFFETFDTAKTIVLGKDKSEKINFIKIKKGKGDFYINTIPILYTNYYFLKGESNKYIYISLSYLTDSDVIWDEYYKPNNIKSGSPLRFIVSKIELRRAYYLLLISVIMFIAFKGKRIQRIIPIKNIEKNKTLEFIKTLSKIYYLQKNHRSIAEKQITYFKENLRSRYGIKELNTDSETIKKLNYIFNISENEIINNINKINYILNKENLSNLELIELNNILEKYKGNNGTNI